MGARTTDFHGWQTPATFGTAAEESAQAGKTAGLADLSWMAKLDVKGAGCNTLPALHAASRSWSLGPKHVLVTCSPAEIRTLLDRMSATAGVGVTDVTSVYAQFLLLGPRSRRILEKLTSLNLGEGALSNPGCAQARLAHVPATVLREDMRDFPAFHLLVSREYGESVWDALLHAGHEYDLRPIGLEAVEALTGGRIC